MTAILVCLSMAIYHEARSEPLVGQAAVAMVILNRVASDRFPDDVCSVVTQERQFPFAWQPPQEGKAWDRAVMIAERTLAGEIVDMTAGALHYHRDDIERSWTAEMTGQRIGDRHIFWTADND